MNWIKKQGVLYRSQTLIVGVLPKKVCLPSAAVLTFLIECMDIILSAALCRMLYTLFMTGRDIRQQDIVLNFDEDKFRWNMVGSAKDEEDKRKLSVVRGVGYFIFLGRTAYLLQGIDNNQLDVRVFRMYCRRA